MLTSGGNDGNIRRVSDYTGTSNTITLRTAATGQITNAMTYELWDEKYAPALIHENINTAILSASRIYDPIENISLHGDGATARFDIPAGIVMLNKLEYRSSFPGVDLHTCDRLFDETTDSNVTQSLQTEDRKEGTSSLRFVYAAGAGVNTLVTDSITSINISKYTTMEMWIKSSVGTAAADLHLLLDDTAGAGSPLETLAIPALTADTWMYVRVALANPRLDTAIISVGFRYTVDLGAATIWIDHIKVVNNNGMIWSPLYKDHWWIDLEARDLILSTQGRSTVGYRLIKLTGAELPIFLSADADINEVDDEYVIAKTVALTLTSVSGGPGTDPDESMRRAAFWEARAEQAKRRFPFITNGRAVV